MPCRTFRASRHCHNRRAPRSLAAVPRSFSRPSPFRWPRCSARWRCAGCSTRSSATRLPLVTLFGAVAVAVWAGGWRHAALVALLGYVACNYLFIAPRGVLAPRPAPERRRPGRLRVHRARSSSRSARRCAARARAPASAASCCASRSRSIGDAVITTDVEGRVTYLNAVAEALTGWTHARRARAGRSTRCSGSSASATACRSRTRRRARCAKASSSASPTTRPDREGRQRAPDRRQRRADPGRARRGLRAAC